MCFQLDRNQIISARINADVTGDTEVFDCDDDTTVLDGDDDTEVFDCDDDTAVLDCGMLSDVISGDSGVCLLS